MPRARRWPPPGPTVGWGTFRWSAGANLWAPLHLRTVIKTLLTEGDECTKPFTSPHGFPGKWKGWMIFSAEIFNKGKRFWFFRHYPPGNVLQESEAYALFFNMPVVDLPRREARRGHGMETDHHQGSHRAAVTWIHNQRREERQTDLPIWVALTFCCFCHDLWLFSRHLDLGLEGRVKAVNCEFSPVTF